MRPQANLTELKSFGSPPNAVLMVMGAVMVLILGVHGKVPKDRFVGQFVSH
jgi:dynein heavy chain